LSIQNGHTEDEQKGLAGNKQSKTNASSLSTWTTALPRRQNTAKQMHPLYQHGQLHSQGDKTQQIKWGISSKELNYVALISRE